MYIDILLLNIFEIKMDFWNFINNQTETRSHRK